MREEGEGVVIVAGAPLLLTPPPVFNKGRHPCLQSPAMRSSGKGGGALLPPSPVTDPQTTRTSLAGVGFRVRVPGLELGLLLQVDEQEARTTSTACMTPAQALGSPVTSLRLRKRAATAGTRWRCLANQLALKIPRGRVEEEEEEEEEEASCSSSSSSSLPLARPKSSAAPASGSDAETVLQGGRCAERRYSATGVVDWGSPRRATRASGGVATSGGYESISSWKRSTLESDRPTECLCLSLSRRSTDRCLSLSLSLCSLIRPRRRRSPEGSLDALCALVVEEEEKDAEREREPLLLSRWLLCSPDAPAPLFRCLIFFLKSVNAAHAPKLQQTKTFEFSERGRERATNRHELVPVPFLLDAERAHACLLQRTGRPLLEEPTSAAAAAAIAVGVFVEKLGRRRRRRDAARRRRLELPRPRPGCSLFVDLRQQRCIVSFQSASCRRRRCFERFRKGTNAVVDLATSASHLAPTLRPFLFVPFRPHREGPVDRRRCGTLLRRGQGAQRHQEGRRRGRGRRAPHLGRVGRAPADQAQREFLSFFFLFLLSLLSRCCSLVLFSLLEKN